MKQQWIIDLQQKMSGYKEPSPEVSWAELEAALLSANGLSGHTTSRIWVAFAALLLAIVAGVGIRFSGIHSHHGKESFITILPPVEVFGPGSSDGFSNRSLLADISPISSPGLWETTVSGPALSVQEEILPMETLPERHTAPPHSVKTSLPKPGTEHLCPVDALSQVDTGLLLRKKVNGTTAGQTHRLTAKAYVAGAAGMSGSESPGVNHYPPVRLGVTFHYDINRRCSIGSGISYSYHRSGISTQVGDESYIARQQVSYLGIPLNMDYLLLCDGRFNLYTSCGGMVEKMVRGQQTGVDEPLQFSVNGALGFEFKLNDLMSLYAEPGLRYSFDNGGIVCSVYRDRPLDFNLCLGVRLGL